MTEVKQKKRKTSSGIYNKMKLFGLTLLSFFLAESLSVSFEYNSELEGELKDLVELVPFNEMLSVCMEYASGDEQTMKFMEYLQGEKFRKNLEQIKNSQLMMAEAVGMGNSFKEIMEKLETVLNMAALAPHGRSKRSPGEGLLSLIKEQVELLPLVDIKESYRHKINTSEKFKAMMDRILGDDVREYIEYIGKSKPLQDTREDLIELGIPVDDITEFVSDELTEFFFSELSDHEHEHEPESHEMDR